MDVTGGRQPSESKLQKMLTAAITGTRDYGALNSDAKYQPTSVDCVECMPITKTPNGDTQREENLQSVARASLPKTTPFWSSLHDAGKVE